MALKYNEGDKVRIKSKEWYDANKDEYGNVHLNGEYSWMFTERESRFCGKIVTILCKGTTSYAIVEDSCEGFWIDEMIECKVEEKSKKEVISWLPNGKLIAEKFNDGTITISMDKFKYNKISINTEFCDDKVELVISPDFELKQEGDTWFAVKKQPKYPQTYKECCAVMGFSFNWDNPFSITKDTHPYIKNLDNLMEGFCKLRICRDAYWKIAGEEMELGKSWEPDWNTPNKTYYTIIIKGNEIYKSQAHKFNEIFAFPTEEMRDAFYENFEELIESVKELL